VLSSLPWNLVEDKLTQGLNDSDYYTGYSDDTAKLINGKFHQTVSQSAMGILQQWCNKTYLSRNHNKMVIIIFTKKRALRNNSSYHD
jgi:hypothetical protein